MRPCIRDLLAFQDRDTPFERLRAGRLRLLGVGPFQTKRVMPYDLWH